jgi:hypothetical protein
MDKEQIKKFNEITSDLYTFFNINPKLLNHKETLVFNMVDSKHRKRVISFHAYRKHLRERAIQKKLANARTQVVRSKEACAKFEKDLANIDSKDEFDYKSIEVLVVNDNKTNDTIKQYEVEIKALRSIMGQMQSEIKKSRRQVDMMSIDNSMTRIMTNNMKQFTSQDELTKNEDNNDHLDEKHINIIGDIVEKNHDTQINYDDIDKMINEIPPDPDPININIIVNPEITCSTCSDFKMKYPNKSILKVDEDNKDMINAMHICVKTIKDLIKDHRINSTYITLDDIRFIGQIPTIFIEWYKYKNSMDKVVSDDSDEDDDDDNEIEDVFGFD